MSESDDSDAEGGLGNVTRIVLRPPGHSGKAKRGHLCFDASYESGNLGRVDFISEYEYDLFIRPDTCNPRYRLWFNFVVDNVRADQRVVFNLVNLCKIKTLFRDGMTPLVKTSSRPKWQRLPGKYVYYHKSPEHRNHYILSFAFAFDREEDVYQFAFSFPYSYSRCQAHLELVEQRELAFFRRETIGVSLQNRKLDVITISSLPSPALVAGKKPKLIVIMARSHPGESPTSYVAQGLIDFMVSSHQLAAALREYVVIKIVPMINPDGVFLGNYRSSLMGYDLNRHWNQVSPWAHPTLHAIKNYLLDLDLSKTLDLDMIIDIHAHSSLMGAFIYGNSYDDVYRFERHILFPKLLAHNAEDYSTAHTMYNRDPSKCGTARRHLCEVLRNTVNVYTLELSFLGYNQSLTNSTVTYNEDGYFRLGRNLARTFFEYYKVTGVIPANILSATPSGAIPSQDTDKKTPRARSRSRSRSRMKAKTSETQAQAKQKPLAQKSVQHDDIKQSSAADKTVVKLSSLTKEQHDSDDGSSDSNKDDQILEHKPRHKNMKQHESSKYPPASAATATTTKSSTRKSSMLSYRVRAAAARIRAKSDSDGSSSPSPVRKDKRKLSRVSKATYRNFDFSALRDVDVNGSIVKEEEKIVRVRRSSARSGTRIPATGRKIGGGGIISRKRDRGRRESYNELGGGGAASETEAPCLTIIDFNLLIRKGLEKRQSLDRGWRGWSRKFHNGGRGRQGVSAKEGDGRSGGLHRSASYRRRHSVRRRRAVLLRGTVTDCSPWDEDTSSDSCSTHRSVPKNLHMFGKKSKDKKRPKSPSSSAISLVSIVPAL